MPVEAVSTTKSSPSNISGSDTEALDAYITGQMSKHGIKGISLAITSGTKIVYLKGYGTAGEGRLMTPQTPMYIGSQAKGSKAREILLNILQDQIIPAGKGE